MHAAYGGDVVIVVAVAASCSCCRSPPPPTLPLPAAGVSPKFNGAEMAEPPLEPTASRLPPSPPCSDPTPPSMCTPPE